MTNPTGDRYYLPKTQINRIFDVIEDTYESLSNNEITAKKRPLMGSMVLYDLRTHTILGRRDINRDEWSEGSDYEATVYRKMEFALSIMSDSEMGQINPVLWQEGDCEWAGFTIDSSSLLGFGFSGAEGYMDVVLCELGLSLCRAIPLLSREKESIQKIQNNQRRPGTIGAEWPTNQ